MYELKFNHKKNTFRKKKHKKLTMIISTFYSTHHALTQLYTNTHKSFRVVTNLSLFSQDFTQLVCRC